MPLKKESIPNPLRGENAVLSFQKKGFLEFDNAEVKFFYIPDREIINEGIFSSWFKQSQIGHKEPCPEHIASYMLDSFYNEILPYYVSLDITINHNSGAIQRVKVIKHQPNYKLPKELYNIIY